MIKKFILLLSICIIQSSFSQELNFSLYEKLTQITRGDIDKLMIDGYGYEKISPQSENEIRKYGFVLNNNWDKAIVLTVKFPSKPGYNAIEIDLGKGFKESDIKKNNYRN